MIWISIKKGGESVHIAYNKTFSNNIFIYNTQICIKPKFALKFDLNPNLRKKNKSVSSYIDTVKLIEQGVNAITLIQINDNTIIKGISKFLSDEWDIIIELKGEHSFKAKPELNSYGMFLKIK